MCGDIKRGRRLSGPSRGCLRVGANWGHGRVWSTPQTGPICAGNYTPSTIIQRTYVLHSDGRNSKPNNVESQSAWRRHALRARRQPLSCTYTSPPARLLAEHWRTWTPQLVTDLAGPHPDLPGKLKRADLMRYGHAMSIP